MCEKKISGNTHKDDYFHCMRGPKIAVPIRTKVAPSAIAAVSYTHLTLPTNREV